MFVLGIDTSNYATSLAIYDSNAKEVVCDKKEFLPVKQGALGLRQSDAVFHHTVALPNLLKQLHACVPLTQIEAVGVLSLIHILPETAEKRHLPSPGRPVMW